MSIRRVVLVALLFLAPLPALAQGVRSLGMGGVTPPDAASDVNPAYAALPGAGTSIQLPVGLLNALVSDRMGISPNNPNLDILSIFDQATHIDTFVLNPAQSPDEVIFSVRSEGGVPVLEIDTVGGSELLLTSGAAGYQEELSLPISFGLGVVSIGVRPYLEVGGRLTPDAAFGQMFADGASSGSAALDLQTEAGVSLDLLYTMPVPVPAGIFPGQFYLGVRAAPFLGLARVEAQATLEAQTVDNGSGEAGFEYNYVGEGFVSLVTEGALGYGLEADIGMAAVLPSPQGDLTFGVAVRDLGIAIWNGDIYTLTGDSSGEQTNSGPQATTRTYVATGWGVNTSVAYELDGSTLGVGGISSLIVVADGDYRAGFFGGHVGSEVGFDVGFATLMARGGVGYERGLLFGVGTGLELPGFAFDLALHSYRSPFTTNRAYGVSAGLRLGL